jgi:hypothetical protein
VRLQKLRVFELWYEDCKSDGSSGELNEVSPFLFLFLGQMYYKSERTH